MLSFPGRHLAPNGLPASRRYSPRQAELRPHSRAVQRLAVAGFRVRPLSSLGLAFAAPACEPDKDTPVTCCSASLPLNAGSATAFDSALARCHGSDLLPLRLHLAHKPAVFFLHRRHLEVTGPCPSPIPSRFACSLCLAFRRLSFGGLAEPPESCVPCWHTVATVYPLGNCDSLKLETSLSYLTRIGTASRPFSLSS